MINLFRVLFLSISRISSDLKSMLYSPQLKLPYQTPRTTAKLSRTFIRRVLIITPYYFIIQLTKRLTIQQLSSFLTQLHIYKHASHILDALLTLYISQLHEITSEQILVIIHLFHVLILCLSRVSNCCTCYNWKYLYILTPKFSSTFILQTQLLLFTFNTTLLCVSKSIMYLAKQVHFLSIEFRIVWWMDGLNCCK